jgi:hypothetical protein
LIRPMQYALKRACLAARKGHRPTVGCTGLSRCYQARDPRVEYRMGRPDFDRDTCGASVRGRSIRRARPHFRYEYVAMPLSQTASQQNESEFKRTSVNRICWPVEAGVDAQYFDSP